MGTLVRYENSEVFVWNRRISISLPYHNTLKFQTKIDQKLNRFSFLAYILTHLIKYIELPNPFLMEFYFVCFSLFLF